MENGEWSMRHVQNGSSNWNAAATATMGNFHFNFRSFARPPSHCDICNIFCSFAAFGDALRVLFSSLFFLFLLDLVWQKTFACWKKKLLLEMFCGMKRGRAAKGARIGHSGILWQQFSAARVCVCVCVGKTLAMWIIQCEMGKASAVNVQRIIKGGQRQTRAESTSAAAASASAAAVNISMQVSIN